MRHDSQPDVAARRRRSRAKAARAARLYQALRRNAITAWREDAFEEPYIADRNLLGGFVLLNDPDLIRHVLIDNAANYPKDDSAAREAHARGRARAAHRDGGDWRLQRRTVAPLFQPAGVASYLAADGGIGRRDAGALGRHAQSGATVDIAREMTALTYDIISRTVFSHEIETLARCDGRGDHHLFRRARADRPVGRAAAAALAAAPGFHPRETRAEDLSRRGAPPVRAPPRAHRGGRERAGRSGDAADRGARSGERRAALRRRHPRQSRHVHRRRPRDHRECADLDAVPACRNFPTRMPASRRRRSM